MKKNYRHFHEVKKAFIVAVCEGEGTDELPFYEAYYIFDEDFNKVGTIEPEKYKKKYETTNQQ